MTCIRDIMNEEQLERELNRILHFFKDLSKDEKPLRIEWGTREAMEKAEESRKEIVEWVEGELMEMVDHISDIEFYLDKQAKTAGELGDEEAYDRFRAKSDQAGYFLTVLDNFAQRFHMEFGEKSKGVKKGVLEEKWEPTYITTNFPPGHKFHDDQISDREVVVKSFPYMHIFGDFRLLNGHTIKEFDDFLARLVPLFCELEKMHAEKKMGGVGSEEKAEAGAIDFEKATEIAVNLLREHGHPHPKLYTTVPLKDGWEFTFDVGAVFTKIMAIRVNKEGKVVKLEPEVVG